MATRVGHASVALTLDHYGHLFEGHDEDLRDRLDAMITAGSVRARPAEVRSLRS